MMLPRLGYFDTVTQEQIDTVTTQSCIVFAFSGYWLNVENKLLKILLINKVMFLCLPVMLLTVVKECHKHTSVNNTSG